MEDRVAQSNRLDFGLFQLTREQLHLGLFALAVLALRLACINLNQGEYTDGLMQITRFTDPALSNYTWLWPPLYSVLCFGLNQLGVELETAARLISMLASVAILYPIFYIAQTVASNRAAYLATLVYAVQPVAWRWSIRVMTDSLFAALFLFSLWLLVIALRSAEKETLFKLRVYTDRRQPTPAGALTFSILFGVLSGMTRYQGILLIPLQVYALLRIARRPGQNQLRKLAVPLLCLLLWLAVLWWMRQSPHAGQFEERVGASLSKTLAIYLNFAESLVYLFPYYVTLPVFIFMVWGLIVLGRSSRRAANEFLGMTIYLIIAVVVMQTAFQSFQMRYLLPLLPLLSICAGAALHAGWPQARDRRRWYRAIVFLTLLNSLCWSGVALLLQREAWGDVRRAAEQLRALALPRNVPVYSHETYNARLGIGAVKLQFWSGHPVHVLPAGAALPRNLEKNSYIVLHSAYLGREAYPLYQQQLREFYHVRKISEEFNAQIIPLLPDLMSIELTNQNPLAWFWRYTEQNFSSSIYYIENRKP